MESTLLINLDDILHYTSVSGSIDELKVLPHILNSQVLYLEPILGSDLYEKILSMVDDGSISGTTNYNILYNNYIIPCLVFHTLELFIPLNSFQIADAGVFQYTANNANISAIDEIEKISNKYRVIGAKYDQKLSDYLCKNGASFPEYINNTGLVGKKEVAPRTSWYLGNKR